MKQERYPWSQREQQLIRKKLCVFGNAVCLVFVRWGYTLECDRAFSHFVLYLAFKTKSFA